MSDQFKKGDKVYIVMGPPGATHAAPAEVIAAHYLSEDEGEIELMSEGRHVVRTHWQVHRTLEKAQLWETVVRGRGVE